MNNYKIISRIFFLSVVFIQLIGVAGAISFSEIGSYDTPGYAERVAVSGNYAYVADQSNGLVIVDVSNAAAPMLAGSYDTLGMVRGVAVSGSYTYVADGNNGLVIIDVSNPAAPVLAGSYDIAYAEGVAVSGSYAYVAGSGNGLVIIDVSNPAAPVLAGSYNTLGNAWRVTVSGSYAYVADSGNGLVIVDIGNPAAPVFAGSYDTPGNAWDVTVSDSYAYVADDTNGLVIVDISNPAAPVLAGSYDTADAYGVAVSGSYAYVADCGNGLAIVDISNTAAPVLAGSYDTLGNAQGVAVSGSYVHVADGLNGLVILSASGLISVSSSPSGASVYLDGVHKGTTPLTITSVLPGSYTIKLTNAGYVDKTKTVNVISHGTTSVSETLALIPTSTGSISVSSSPTDASVYLDGAYKGTTPHTITSVSTGSHTIKLTKTGYVDKTKTVNVVSSATTSVSETLTLIPTSTGSIQVTSNPSGANIYLDGTFKGTTSKTLSGVPIGSHSIKLTKSGYNDFSKTIAISSGQITHVSESLNSLTGSISITSEPSGANIFLDGTYRGIAPLTISDVPVGKHVIVLSKSGYETASTEITVSSGQTKSLSGHLPLHPILIIGGISLLLLAIIGIVVVRKRKKTNDSSGNKVPSTPINTQPSVKQVQPVSIVNTTENPNDKGTIDIKSAFQYIGATIQYKVKIINQTPEPLSDIKIQLYVPEVFMLTEKEKSIPMLEPDESKTVTFDIRPTGECGDCAVSGRMNYYDYSTKKRQDIDIEKKMVSIVCPVLKRKEIDEDEWRNVTDELIKAEENTNDLDIPAENLFNIATRVLKDMNMFMIKPEIINTPQLFTGVGMFYAEGAAGLHYAAYIEVVGGRKSRMILKAWAEKEEALTGFYHKILDEIEKRLDIKIFIDEGIIQYHVHKTEIKDNIIQRSNIDLGSKAQCPECGREVEANEKFCLECGAKL